MTKKKPNRNMTEFVVTGVFPAVALDNGLKSFTVNMAFGASTKEAACREFKRAGVLEVSNGRFLNTNAVVMLVALTKKEFDQAQEEQKQIAEKHKQDLLKKKAIDAGLETNTTDGEVEPESNID